MFKNTLINILFKIVGNPLVQVRVCGHFDNELIDIDSVILEYDDDLKCIVINILETDDIIE